MSDAESASSIVPVATIQSYDDLLAACRRQVAALGINYTILDQVAGFTDGYSSKLLAHSEHCSTGGRRTKRHFSPESFDAYMAALGLKLVAVEDPDKVARLKSFCESKFLFREGPVRSVGSDCLINLKVSRKFMRYIGRNGGIASGRKRRAIALRRRVNRLNALKRWRRQEITSDPPADPDRAPA